LDVVLWREPKWASPGTPEWMGRKDKIVTPDVRLF